MMSKYHRSRWKPAHERPRRSDDFSIRGYLVFGKTKVLGFVLVADIRSVIPKLVNLMYPHLQKIRIKKTGTGNRCTAVGILYMWSTIDPSTSRPNSSTTITLKLVFFL